MHIVQLIDSLRIGGAEKLLVTLAAEAKLRPQLRLSIISLSHDQSTPIPEEIRAHGIPIYSFPAKGLLNPRRIWQIVQQLRRDRCDIIHTHLTYAHIIGAITGRLVGIPVVASLHNTEPDPFVARADALKYQLETWALRYGVQQLVAVGTIVGKANETRLPAKVIQVIPNAVATIPALSLDEQTAIRQSMVDNSAGPLLISVGRLAPQKGYQDLLMAFADVRKKHPSAVLVIAGTGPLRPDLQAQIESLHLEGAVHLLGPRNDVPRLLAASDLFVSASHWEGLPVALLEAMSAGLPVVATKVGDVPEVVVKGTGLVVPPQVPFQLAEAIHSLLVDPAKMKQFGQAAKSHILQNYTSQIWVDRLLALYMGCFKLQETH
jgi:glycosyltransferase involved in cell wall biosynthesis